MRPVRPTMPLREADALDAERAEGGAQHLRTGRVPPSGNGTPPELGTRRPGRGDVGAEARLRYVNGHGDRNLSLRRDESRGQRGPFLRDIVQLHVLFETRRALGVLRAGAGEDPLR